MKSLVVVAAAMLTPLVVSSRAQAQSRVSIEVGGVISAYDVPSAPAASRAALRANATNANATSSSASTIASDVISSGGSAPAQGIGAFEVRPTVIMDYGFLMGVGFRIGQAGLGAGGTTLVGADIALGYAHRFGAFMPFIKGMFGVNSYDLPGSVIGHQTDMRLDAVIGSRLYLSRRMFLSAAAFAGYGDHYGAMVAIGGDVVQVFRRGALP